MASGDELTEQQRKFAFVLDMPNKWLTLMQYLLNPPLIKRVMAEKCGNYLVGVGTGNQRITAARWLRQNVAQLPQKQQMRLCADKGGVAWKNFHTYVTLSVCLLQISPGLLHLQCLVVRIIAVLPSFIVCSCTAHWYAMRPSDSLGQASSIQW